MRACLPDWQKQHGRSGIGAALLDRSLAGLGVPQQAAGGWCKCDSTKSQNRGTRPSGRRWLEAVLLFAVLSEMAFLQWLLAADMVHPASAPLPRHRLPALSERLLLSD